MHLPLVRPHDTLIDPAQATEKEHKAAVTIQRHYRGYAARKHVQRMHMWVTCLLRLESGNRTGL
jgi:hypothetical protein